MKHPGAGWYDDVENPTHVRWWDGKRWTDHRQVKTGLPAANATAEAASVAETGTVGAVNHSGREPEQASASGKALAIVSGALFALLAIVGWVASGMAGLFAIVGLIILLTGAYVLATKRPSWIRLPSRGMGGLAAGVGALVLIIGSTFSMPPTPVEPLPGPAAAVAPESAKLLPEPTAEPEIQAPAVDTVPLDPENVKRLSFKPSVVAKDTTATSGTALEVLETLPVKGRAPKTGYDREAKFGTAWMDIDGNGCDTRNDVLARDLVYAVKASDKCKIVSGEFQDPYTGKHIEFVRGNDTSAFVQVDHVVSLSDAWQKGAQQLSQAQRITLANDPLNLYAVDGAENSAKGAGDAATWLPSNRAIRCEYVARQISVKATYALWVSSPEKDAMKRILAECETQPSVTSQFTPAPVAPEPEPAPEPAPAPAPEPAPAPQTIAEQPAPAPAPAPATAPPAPSAYYKNCTAARAAGAAPVYAGDPGYGRHLDRDGDGVGCE